jgi:hypothetical protein
MNRLAFENFVGNNEDQTSDAGSGAIVGGVYAAAVISLAVLVLGGEMGDIVPVLRLF